MTTWIQSVDATHALCRSLVSAKADVHRLQANASERPEGDIHGVVHHMRENGPKPTVARLLSSGWVVGATVVGGPSHKPIVDSGLMIWPRTNVQASYCDEW